MTIVTLLELCKMPPGTIFSMYAPNVVEGLFCKEDTLFDDDGADPPSVSSCAGLEFFYVTLLAHDVGGELVTSNALSRWNTYNAKEQFVVYGDKEVTNMIKRLEQNDY